MSGFDAVEIHAAHGYILHQFLSPAGNIREDRYGGNTLNRCRILVDIILGIKEVCGADFPIICKLDGNEHIPGGIDAAESVRIARHLEQAGADALLVSAGCGASLEWILPPAFMPSAPNLTEARAIGQIVNLPVGLVGKIDDLEQVDQCLAAGEFDFIALARPLLADPNLPRKLGTNRAAGIRPCIYCNEKCNSIDDQYQIGCSVNPGLGRETEAQKRPRSPKPQKVMIIGGGPAGLQAAEQAALRGHLVHLVEKSAEIGGQVNLVQKIPGKDKWAGIIRYYRQTLDRLKVSLHLGQEADIRILEEVDPATIIIATGAVSDMNLFAVSAEARLTSSFEAIARGNQIAEEKITIIGAQKLAVDTAMYLASIGKQVSILARGGDESYLQQNITRSYWPHILEAIKQYEIKIIPGASVTGIDAEYIYLNRNGREESLSYHRAVLAAYLKPLLPGIMPHIESMGVPVYKIGDCVQPRSLAMATTEGYDAAWQV